MTTHLVLFDFDGTLADTAPDLAAAANRLRTTRGMTALPYEALRPYASHGARGLIKAALDMDTENTEYEQVRKQFLADYAANMLADARLFAGIAELLATLDQHSLGWGIVTNKSQALALPMVEYLGLAKNSKITVGGDTTAYTKPHPEPLLYAARQTGFATANCVYIGDDERDVIAGKAAGMSTIAAAYGYCSLDDPARWNAGAIAEQPSDLWPIIQDWFENHKNRRQ